MSFLVSNLHFELLQSRFRIPARCVLATEADLPEAWGGGAHSYYEKFPHSYGYQTFSRVGFNRDFSEAVFYTEHLCGLCGEGEYVFMRKVNGEWRITSEASTWVS